MSEEKNKPVPDEQTLAKLLQAAYVLQEHNREMQQLPSRPGVTRDGDETKKPASPGQSSSSAARSTGPSLANNTSTLAKIVETQHQIQVNRFDFASSLKLVAERVSLMTSAAGAAIGIIEGNGVRYRAVSGYSTPPRDSVVTVDKSMFAPCLKTGQAFHCTDTSNEMLLDADACKRRGIHSLIAVPVYHDGGIAGGLELYYASPNAFTEQEVHTCQLMAGLVAEALIREEEATWKKSLAIERAAMLEALEKLQPNLAALVEQPPAKNAPAPDMAEAPYSCRKCGHKLMPEEQFCGECGSARASDYEPSNTQSKVASLWQMQESQKKAAGGESIRNEFPKVTDTPGTGRPESSLARALEEQIPGLFNSDDLKLIESDETVEPSAPINQQAITRVDLEDLQAETDGVSDEAPKDPRAGTNSELTKTGPWSSAASARTFLEQLSSSKRFGPLVQFWNRHRGDIYLGIAVILVLCVVRWGLSSERAAKATASPTKPTATQRKAAADDGLSFFDRMLIQLGLAEAPEAPADKGNPGVQVWVDLKTALYYCPGTDLYGKTPKGKFTTQREAQLDQFEPAYRKACN